MKKFEYKIVKLECDENRLNLLYDDGNLREDPTPPRPISDLGNTGWELTTILSYGIDQVLVGIFKRET